MFCGRVQRINLIYLINKIAKGVACQRHVKQTISKNIENSCLKICKSQN